MSMIERLRRRARFCRDYGRETSPDLMEEAAALLEEAAGALALAIPGNVCLTNRNVRDDAIVSLDAPIGDLRKIAATLTKIRGATYNG